MKKFVLCKCNSGEPYDDCCAPNTRIWALPISNPAEHAKMTEKLKISSAFNMRYRGLVQFYGNDLIEYKQLAPKCKLRNAFLELLAKYFTDFHEDTCPDSWQECQSAFWEEFIILFYPHHLKVTPQKNEVEEFLHSLKKFIRWLDKRNKSNLFEVVQPIIKASLKDLKATENLIGSLILHAFPNLHNEHQDLQEDVNQHVQLSQKYDEEIFVVCEITSIESAIVIGQDLDSPDTYQIINLPLKYITPGTILSGTIAKNKGDWLWNWRFPKSAFPQSAKKFMDDIIMYY